MARRSVVELEHALHWQDHPPLDGQSPISVRFPMMF
jgi:hypothetical protein